MENRYLCKAKWIDNGEWIIGYVVFQGECADIIQTDQDGTWRWYPVDKNTICQCTGLEDKNGKLIWENDILMCHGNSKDLVKVVFGEFDVINMETESAVDSVVGWHYEVIPTDALSKCEPFCLSMPVTEDYVKICEFETIGNIFDNQELLEVFGT